MKPIYCMGEALIDMIPGSAQEGRFSCACACGGAPANVAAAVAKLGGDARMISMVGEDAFGDSIISTLSSVGVDASRVFRTKEAHTTLAVVSLQEDGNRSFSFYRSPGADQLLAEDLIQEDWFSDCFALHFCSVALVDSPAKEAHRKAVKAAKRQGALISFDPNIRLPLWSSEAACLAAVEEFMPYADLLKFSEEELLFLTGERDLSEGAGKLFERYPLQMILYSKGSQGAMLLTREERFSVPGVSVQAKDTTGAGDALAAAFLYGLSQGWEPSRCLQSANSYAAKSVAQYGAIPSYSSCLE